jgi:hypothetical protein
MKWPKPLIAVLAETLPEIGPGPAMTAPCVVCDERVEIDIPIHRMYLVPGCQRAFSAHAACLRWFEKWPRTRQLTAAQRYPH